jgi:Zn-dependent peptidase ImmA (M78 family)
VTLPRGFKASAEREAQQLRAELGLRPTDRLDLDALGEHLKIRIISAETLVERSRLEELERLQAYAFSAATFKINDKDVIVTNPLRSTGRLASDVAHEISHLRLKHTLTEIREIAGMPFRTCKPDEEEQATALGGTLLLPRPLLVAAARRGFSVDQIAETYGVTTTMARYRYNTTGVGRQLAAD